MTTHRNRRGSVAAIAAMAMAIIATTFTHAVATVIVADTFTGGPNGPEITGRTPETTLPGGNWLKATGQASIRTTTTPGFGNSLEGAFGNHQNASAVSIADSGTFIKDTKLRISADLAPRNTAGSAAVGRGVGLGFFNSVGNSQQFSQNRFTGLVLDSAGNLNLVQDPNLTGFYGAGSTLGAPIAFGGAFNPNAFHRLSYDVDTVTGSISNISLGSSTASYSFPTNLFTDAATAFAGANTSSAVANTFGALDNFSVEGLSSPIEIFNTGVDANGNVVSNGTPDIHFTITSPAAATPNKRAANGAWLGNDPNGSPGSAWLDGITQLNTTFTYRTIFDLTGLNPKHAELAMLLAADNRIDDVRINGVSTGITVPFGFPAFQSLNGPFSITTGFVGGINTLEFDVVATGGDSGFRAEISGIAQTIPEPSAVTLAVFGLGGLMSRRRNRVA